MKLPRTALLWSASCLTLLLFAKSALAQLPATRLDGLFPAGATPGQELEITIFGADLDGVDQLHFSHPGITASQKIGEATPFDEGPQPLENQFILKVAENVPTGKYEIRCQGKYGLSGPRTFVVDSFHETIETEPNASVEQATEVADIPLVINGQLNGAADVDWYKFSGRAGQRLLIQANAGRLDSPAVIVMTLASEDGRVLGESHRVGIDDPSLDIQLESDGTYFLRIHDLLYKGGVDYVYRIVIADLPVIDFVFPPAGSPGSNELYSIYGRNLPGGQATTLFRRGQVLEKLDVRIPVPGDVDDTLQYSDRLAPHQAGLDAIEYRIDTPSGQSNPVLISVATAPVITEQEENDTSAAAQQITIPCEVAGHFYPQRDIDWYTFDAKSGEECWIEVYSHRLGLPTDPSLVVLQVEQQESGDEKVTQLAWVDDVNERDGGAEFDERTHDPVYQFKAPADGTYRILVREGHSSVVSDPSLVYRLAVRRAKPDFRLAMTPIDSSGELLLRKGGREAVKVVVFRQDGFAGEIRLSASGLPAGVTASEIIVGPDSTQAVFVLSAASDAAPGIGELKLVGKSIVGGKEVTRVARTGHPLASVPFTQPNNRNQPSLPARLTEKLPIVVSASEIEPVVLSLADPAPLETSRGGIVKLKYNVTRQEGAAGNVIGYAFGLPRVMNNPTVNMAAKPDGELELKFPANMTPGTYTTNLAATLQGVNYSRNPEAAAKAEERQKRVEKIYVDAQQKTRQAQKAVQQTQNELNQSNTLLTQANSEKTKTETAAAALGSEMNAAANKLAELQKQLDAKPDDDALKQQFIAAEAALAAATEKAKTATEAASRSATEAEEAAAKQKSAQQAKTKADEEFKAAQAFERQAQQEKQRADAKARTLKQQANPRGVNQIIYATPVSITVTDHPIKLTTPDQKLVLKQGEKLEIPLKIERLYEFKQQVNFQLLPPQGVSGLQIQNINISADKSDAAINVTASATATPGDHTVILRATLNFNGQNLTLEKNLQLSVAQVEAEK